MSLDRNLDISISHIDDDLSSDNGISVFCYNSGTNNLSEIIHDSNIL